MNWMKLCIVILLINILFVSGCVSKSTFEKVQSDLTNTQQSLTAATSDLEVTKSQLSKVQSDLTNAQQSLTAATSDLEVTKSQLSKLQSELTNTRQSLTAVTADMESREAYLTMVQSGLTKVNQTLTTLNSSVNKAQPYVDIANGYLSFLLAGVDKSTPDAASALTRISMGVLIANDLELSSVWGTFRTNPNIDSNTAFIKLLIQRLNETKFKP